MKNLRRCWGSFHPLYRGTWFPTAHKRAPYTLSASCFHPLYRGTWTPTVTSGQFQNGKESFNPLYRGTWFPTRLSDFSSYNYRTEFQSAISRYLVSNATFPENSALAFQEFQSAISRYLVSNALRGGLIGLAAYRVSIRYIAVLGFQPNVYTSVKQVEVGFQSAISRYLVSNPSQSLARPQRVHAFQSAISRYLVSNRFANEPVSFIFNGFNPLYRGTWFPTWPSV